MPECKEVHRYKDGFCHLHRADAAKNAEAAAEEQKAYQKKVEAENKEEQARVWEADERARRAYSTSKKEDTKNNFSGNAKTASAVEASPVPIMKKVPKDTTGLGKAAARFSTGSGFAGGKLPPAPPKPPGAK
jgi:hypothetical protein